MQWVFDFVVVEKVVVQVCMIMCVDVVGGKDFVVNVVYCDFCIVGNDCDYVVVWQVVNVDEFELGGG